MSMYRFKSRTFLDIAPIFLFAIFALVLANFSGWDRAGTLMIVNAILVLGMYIFIGNSGIISFGHVGFVAIGAYVGALVTMDPAIKRGIISNIPDSLADLQISPFLGVLVGGVAAAIVGAVLAAGIMKLDGLAAGISTMAFLIVVQTIIGNATEITGGRNSLVGIPGGRNEFALILWFVVLALFAYIFQRSVIGRRLRASREDSVAAASLGISVMQERRVAMVLSAFVMGVGGALYGQVLGSIAVEGFYFALTFSLLLMLVFGGTNSLLGVVVGTISITLISESLRRTEAYGAFGFDIARSGTRELGLASIMLLVLYLLPKGVARGKELGELILDFRDRKGCNRIHTAGASGGEGNGPADERVDDPAGVRGADGDAAQLGIDLASQARPTS